MAPIASSGKQLAKMFIYGGGALVLYFLLYLFEDSILEFTSRGGWYFAGPVAIAFVISYVHGNFTSQFWDMLGIKAKK
ncbi:MAG: hypothetical protein A2140_00575 [Candidatus Muproteobacteria bacterium RBG_16_62_13]|uniref:Uncharacterized protein n=1 Tax=Candidatus Muproteobacteria bacterium RBG_16_62_13 TaxID=1817756 RepID=A0A1F6T3S7_9PROT|nr:MAG: hypothetical protein A2140_00575 [Candidatus Muproteobacteria bacterium RBG_16_62_13]